MRFETRFLLPVAVGASLSGAGVLVVLVVAWDTGAVPAPANESILPALYVGTSGESVGSLR